MFSQGPLYTDHATTARLNALEVGLARVQSLLRNQPQTNKPQTQQAAQELSPSDPSPGVRASDPTQQEPADRDSPRLSTRPVVEAAVDIYIKFCDFQPLPLFSLTTWKTSFASWDVELLLSIVASALRFTDGRDLGISILDVDKRQYAAAAQKLVMHKVSYGPMDISTIQFLCILILNEFHDGYTARAGVFS